MGDTPGQWTADRGVVLDTDGIVVGVALDPLSRLSDEELFSNARKMAAAPDLLEDHKEIRNYRHWEECEGWCPKEIAEAAIAKARGKT